VAKAKKVYNMTPRKTTPYEKLGRPTKYKPEYCQAVIDHMSKGFSFEAFAGSILVAVDSLYEWTAVHPTFSEAKKIGNAARLQYNEDLLNKLVNGQLNGSTAAQIFRMKNLGSGLRWADKIESEVNVSASVRTQVIPSFGE
jgi:hypothetical protein